MKIVILTEEQAALIRKQCKEIGNEKAVCVKSVLLIAPP